MSNDQAAAGNKEVILEVKGLTLRRDDGTGSAIFDNVNLTVNAGDVLILRGRSGSGKTSLLKCLSELSVYQSGRILLHGKTASERDGGVPEYRTRVLYVPQRPSMLPGTPKDFLDQVLTFAARTTSFVNEGEKEQARERCRRLATEWGLEAVMWGRDWATLSGGEAQRMALAIAVGIGKAEIICADEPTSALDSESMQQVERSLLAMLPGGDKPNGTLKALVWITHDDAQADRVGTKTFNLEDQ